LRKKHPGTVDQTVPGFCKEKEEKEKYETFDLHLYYTERILNKKVAIC
jgi:hypothetical protein